MAYKRISPQPVVEGGTGRGIFSQHYILVGDDVNPINTIAPGTTGQVLLGVTGADPVFGAASSGIIPTITANFDNVLSIADTDVQKALDTIDDFGSGANAQTVHLYDGAAEKIVYLGSTNTTSQTTVQAGSAGFTLTTATANGPISMLSGTGQIDISNDNTNAIITIGQSATGLKQVGIGNSDTGSLVDIFAGTGGLHMHVEDGDATLVAQNDISIESGGAGYYLDMALSASTAQTVRIGYTAAQPKYIYIGSSNGAASTLIQSGTGDLNLISADAILLDSTGVIELNSSAGNISVGNDAVAQTVNINTGAAAKSTYIGSQNTTSATRIYGGSGDIRMETTGGKVLVTADTDININSTSGNIVIGSNTATQNVYVGYGNGPKTAILGSYNTTSSTTLRGGTSGINLRGDVSNAPVNIYSGTAATNISTDANATTVSLGTGAAVKNVTVGSTNTTSVTTVQAGSTGLTLTTATANGPISMLSGTGQIDISNDAAATTVNVAAGAAAKSVTVGSTNTSSSLALCYGTNDFSLASATGTVMNAYDTGEITFPLQPAFSAVLDTTVVDVTGDGTYYTVVFDTEIVDRNSDWDGTYFTAPVTGLYQFNAGAQLFTIPSGDSFWAYIYTSNRNYCFRRGDENTGLPCFSGSVLADLDLADTAYFVVMVDGGTKTIDINGIVSSRIYTWFNGNLQE